MVGLVVIFGWYTNTTILMQINPAYTPMQYNTALCFLLTGFGLIAYHRAPRISAVLGGFAFLISATTLSEYIFSVNVGLDHLFLTPYLVTNTIYPGRMAPNTALYISLIGFVLCWRFPLLAFKNLPFLKITLALFVALSGAIGLLGYSLDAPIAYGWGIWAPMAIHTSLCFTIIGMGLAIVIWNDYNLTGVRKKITLPIIIIVLGSLLFMFLWQVLIQNEQHTMLQKSRERAIIIDRLVTNKLDDFLGRVKHLQRRYSQKEYATDAAQAKDTNNYPHDIPTLIVPMITGGEIKAHPLLLQMQTADAKYPIQRCADLSQQQHPLNSMFFIISNLQKKYLCLASPVSQQQLFTAVLNISQLMSNTVKRLPGTDDFAVQLLHGRQVLYQANYKNTMYQRTLGITIPVAFKNLSLQLKIWPTESMVKRNQSWFPFVSLIVGSSVTFLLAFMVHLFQLVTEKEKKFRSVLNTTSDAVIIVNRNSEIILSNYAALKLLDYTEHELLGMSVESLMPEKFRKAHKIYQHNYMKSPVKREMGVTKNITLRTKHGEEIPVEIGLNPLQINLEQCILCSIHDMRLAKASEEQLIQQSQSMQIMLDITNSIVTEDSLYVALQRFLNIICTNFQWPIGHVYLVDTNNKDLLIPSEIWFLKDAEKVSHFRDITMKTPLAYGVGLSGRVLVSGLPVWIDDVCLESNFPRASAANVDNVHSAFAFPIKMHGKIMGVFEFFAYEPKKQDKNLILIINVLINQASYFLEYQAIQDFNKNLATRFKFAVALGKIGVWEYDSISKKLIWDKQMYQLYGVSPKIKNLNYSNWKNALHRDDEKKIVARFQQAIKEMKPFDTVFRIVKPNGDVRYIQANAMIINSEDGKKKTMLGMNRDITEEKELTEKLKQLNATLEHQAYYDSLTGLMNRHALDDVATRQFSLAKRHHYQMGVLFVDIDHFKAVNDKFGHSVGDELLVEVAKRLRKILRNEDAICRMGGDEFLVILNNIKNDAAAVITAKKIVADIARPFHLTSHEIHIGASVGVSLYPKSGETFPDLLNKADAALLEAKNSGKGCVHVFKERE